MTRRVRKVKAYIAAAAERCAELVDELAREVQDLKVGEVLHAQMKMAPNEILVIAEFVNKPATPFEDEQRFSCHCCGESLTQGTVASWSVSVSRADGTRWQCVISTCSDEACRQRLVERLDSEGP